MYVSLFEVRFPGCLGFFFGGGWWGGIDLPNLVCFRAKRKRVWMKLGRPLYPKPGDDNPPMVVLKAIVYPNSVFSRMSSTQLAGGVIGG